MPYYLHPPERSPNIDEDPSFDSKPEAMSWRTEHRGHETWSITFQCSYMERRTWKDRERRRFAERTYINVPWAYDTRFTDDYRVFIDHYAHLSLNEPGMVAYTPDDEYGTRDRQIRTTPARYLGKFAKFLVKREIDRFVAECKARTDGKGPQLAKTAEDIVAVYTHGPGSCMSHDAEKFTECLVKGHPVHPTTVYGGSDLAVAYLGSLDQVSARCVVWPDRKVYGRLYGDPTLQIILQNAEYTAGSMIGAKVRAIETDSGAYLMPYIDSIENADLRGRWFVLGDGPFMVQGTDGTTSERELASCEYCGNAYDAENEGSDGYCPSCCDDRASCARCGATGWNDDMPVIGGRAGRTIVLCESCEEEHRVECAIEDCENVFYPYWQLTTTDRQRRADAGLDSVCPSCERAGWLHCSDHGGYYTFSDPCSECASMTIDDLPHGAPKPVNEYTTTNGGGTFLEALKAGRWTIADAAGSCLVWNCRRPIAIGDLFVQNSHGFGYCRSCAYGKPLPAAVVPSSISVESEVRNALS